MRSLTRWAQDIRRGTGLLRAERKGLSGDEAKAAAAKLAVPFRWHLLRHTNASRLVMAGVSLRTVQAMIGHASMTTTAQVYSHLAPDAFDEVRRRLPGGIGSTGKSKSTSE